MYTSFFFVQILAIRFVFRSTTVFFNFLTIEHNCAIFEHKLKKNQSPFRNSHENISKFILLNVHFPLKIKSFVLATKIWRYKKFGTTKKVRARIEASNEKKLDICQFCNRIFYQWIRLNRTVSVVMHCFMC